MKSLYIHIPFCKHKCFYCDFNSYCGKDDLIDKYIKSLKKELDLIIHKEGFKTIYIGGGTPSYIPSKYIKEILESARCDGEITIEVNPGTVTIEKLFDYKDAGVNRLSIGLQVIQDELLKSIGRIHNLEDFNDTFKMAREVGFKNINVDLMIGLSNQTLNDVKESVNYIINKNPEHISCYSLITHDDLIKKYPNAFKSLPDDELEREMYYYVCNTLKSNGYIQYEISNF